VSVEDLGCGQSLGEGGVDAHGVPSDARLLAIAGETEGVPGLEIPLLAALDDQCGVLPAPPPGADELEGDGGDEVAGGGDQASEDLVAVAGDDVPAKEHRAGAPSLGHGLDVAEEGLGVERAQPADNTWSVQRQRALTERPDLSESQVMAAMWSRSEHEQRRERRIYASAEHCLAHLVQALDRLSATIVIVAGLKIPALKMGWPALARYAGDPDPKGSVFDAPTEEGVVLQRHLVGLALTWPDHGPSDWLPWLLETRNAMTHRGLSTRMLLSLSERGGVVKWRKRVSIPGAVVPGVPIMACRCPYRECRAGQARAGFDFSCLRVQAVVLLSPKSGTPFVPPLRGTNGWSDCARALIKHPG
jgi:hypothetical protein